jgi:hypothetical protein
MRISPAGGNRNRGAASQPGELRVAGEAVDPRYLADQLRGGDHAKTLLGEELRRDLVDEASKFFVELSDRAGQITDPTDLVTGHPDPRGRLGALQPASDLLLPTRAGQNALGDLPARPQIVKLPAELVHQSGARIDQALTMNDEAVGSRARARPASRPGGSQRPRAALALATASGPRPISRG